MGPGLGFGPWVLMKRSGGQNVAAQCEGRVKQEAAEVGSLLATEDIPHADREFALSVILLNTNGSVRVLPSRCHEETRFSETFAPSSLLVFLRASLK